MTDTNHQTIMTVKTQGRNRLSARSNTSVSSPLDSLLGLLLVELFNGSARLNNSRGSIERRKNKLDHLETQSANVLHLVPLRRN